MQAATQNTTIIQDLLILHIYTGADASFTYYDDDGATFDYQGGAHAKRNITYDEDQRKVSIGVAQGSFLSPVKHLKVVIHGLNSKLESVSLNGTLTHVTGEMNSFFNALEKFDPFYDPEPAPSEPVFVFTTAYTNDALTITW
jgi:alpha-glucosidase